MRRRDLQGHSKDKSAPSTRGCLIALAFWVLFGIGKTLCFVLPSHSSTGVIIVPSTTRERIAKETPGMDKPD